MSSTTWRSALAVMVAAVGTFLPAATTSPPADAATAASRFVAVAPCRALDTRESPGRPLGDAGTIDVAIVGRCGVAAGAVAAAVTVTAVDPAGPGYLTTYPTGAGRPTAAALNYAAGDTIANLQLVTLGDGGRLSVFAKTATHVVVDVTGYFLPADGGTSASGRFVAVDQRRIADTRATGRPAPRSAVRVDPGVPSDAVAVAVTIASTDTRGRGYFTAYPAGTRRPLASSLNVDAAGQTRAASAIVPIDEDGFDVYTRSGDHVIVDITGYFTGPSAPQSSSGLFVGATPTRLVDTRDPWSATGGPRLWDHGTREFATAAITGGPVAAVAANVALTATEDRGWAVAYPARTERPPASSINYDSAGKSIANTVLVATSTRGIAVHALEATHVVIDVTGWFVGEPLPAAGPAPVNAPPADRRVTIIGDSAAAGMRWNGAYGAYQGFVADPRLESCRRLVQGSCRGREGYAPRTVVAEIGVLPTPGPEDILVVATGYNDWHARFAGDFDAVVAHARAKGFHHIAWMEYRSQVGYRLPGSGGAASNYGEMNRILHAKVASGAYPEVRVWGFDAYTAGTSGWFYSDGVHETRLGSFGVADWISRQVRAFDDRPCPQPWAPGRPVASPCPDPDPLPPQIGHPDIAGLYGL